MQVAQSAGLDKPKLNALRKLLEICHRKDGSKLRLYWNIIGKTRFIPGDFCVIEDRRLIAYLGIFIFNEGEAEVTALVNPKYRRKGIFKELLRRAVSLVKQFDIQTLVFCCPEKVPATKAVLNEYGAKYRHTEYDMRWKPTELNFVENPDLSKRFATDSDLDEMIEVDVACFNANYEKVKFHFTNNMQEKNREVWMMYDKDEFVGKIHFRYDEGVAFIHNVCIKPELQGKGLGSYFLKNALLYLTANGHKHIRLDVEAVNKGALNLYLRLGFVSTQTYEFWEMPIYQAP